MSSLHLISHTLVNWLKTSHPYTRFSKCCYAKFFSTGGRERSSFNVTIVAAVSWRVDPLYEISPLYLTLASDIQGTSRKVMYYTWSIMILQVYASLTGGLDVIWSTLRLVMVCSRFPLQLNNFFYFGPALIMGWLTQLPALNEFWSSHIWGNLYIM